MIPMSQVKPTLTILTTLALAGCLACSAAAFADPAGPAPEAVNVTVYASGLNNPRGLKFGPDGDLYVAEGGVGGSTSTAGTCAQVAPPVGPYTGSATGGRISRINARGYRSTVSDNLPSSTTSVDSGASVSGVADVAFLGDTLYGLLAGAGCSHGVQGIPNGVATLARAGRWSLLADLSAFQMANPTAVNDPADFEPDGAWYSMISVKGALYALEPNHGELDRIDADGTISRVADISASQGHFVPTAVTYHDGAFYVGNLGTYPLVQGGSSILKITMAGEVSVMASGFTAIVGLEFDRSGRLYVLENTVGQPFPAPSAGAIVRLDAQGVQTTVASGLMLPTAMTFGGDGALYVSAAGFGFPPGLGQVLKLTMSR